ncbi:MAG: sensor histidine kinase [Acidobacteria bacterium]|nr:sensor histidine kinase [Acidobacteriota bacterium]
MPTSPSLLPPDRALGWRPYAWLVYLSAYIAFPFVARTSPAQWALHVAGFVVFLPLYFAGYWVDGARRLPIVLGLVGLGTALTWLNPAAAVFFVYAASFIGGSRTGREATLWIAGITLAGLAAALSAGMWAPFSAVFVAVFVPLIGFVNLHDAEVRWRDASLRMAHDEIARLAALAERDRIAADLHDLLGQSLSVITLKADLAARLIDRDPARAAAEVKDVAKVSRQALAEVRQAVQGFRTATMEGELSRARSVLASAGVDLHVDAAAATRIATGALTREAEYALALALREAVTNIVRHAGARHCTVSIAREGTAVRLVVQDDGVGGDVTAGSGLTGMKRRIEVAGGTISWSGAQGVRLEAVVPVKGPEGAAHA